MEGRVLRQQPGFACEECRRRKARCDRRRPKCGFCAETGIACVIVDKRQQRGPKKGLLNRMRLQIATLQAQLDEHLEPSLGATPNKIMVQQQPEYPKSDIAIFSDNSRVPQIPSVDKENLALSRAMSTASTTTSTSTTGSTVPTTLDITGIDLAAWVNCMDWQDLGLEGDPLLLLDSIEPLWTNDANAGASLIDTPFKSTETMQAELDHLYFDRVHPICPLVHRRRYCAWAGQENPAPARACLRSAMQTMAAIMSVHWCHLVDHLCRETRRLLETQWHQTRAMSNDEIPLEHIQSWLLLAYAEILRMGEHQAMMTAGRAFRLVQMARLYDVDAPNDSNLLLSPAVSMSTNDDLQDNFSIEEERRRTFWFAFSLDRFLCLRNEWPLTLQEDIIRTRLPAPEVNFQNGQQIRMSFLSEALTQNGPSTLSPFAEGIVLAALYGRCLTHRRTYICDGPETSGADFWTRHEWLASAVEKRLQILAPYSALDNDPMLLFVHMLAHSAVIFHSNTVQNHGAPCHNLERQLVTGAYQRRASVAALEIVRLSKTVQSLSCFKAHPFLPDSLTYAATFLSMHSNTIGGGHEGVKHLLRVLGDVQSINSLAREHFQSLNLKCSLMSEDFSRVA